MGYPRPQERDNAVIPRSLLIALQFLTRLPVHLKHPPEPVELGRSLLWYPLVGLLLGLMLWGLDAWLDRAALTLRAGLLLAAWLLATGALHIDGLADSTDAWIGGQGERERMLAIMKDPHIGPGAVTAIVIVLLLKFAALCAVVAGSHRAQLLLPPFLARCAIPALFASTPYVRANGIAFAHAAQLPRRLAVAVVIASLTGALLIFGTTGALTVLVATLSFLLLRKWLIRYLGGTTGDTAGAMIELIEASVLVLVGFRS
jgi:adenosylcobinamide-GDP ribazoletransferase